jgi:hypothetical protein
MKIRGLPLILLMLSFLEAGAAGAVDCERAASSDRFDVDDNGTVTEFQTGLTWMRCAVGQTWDGTTCKGGPKALSWQQANDYIADLNKNGGYATHSDWRLPKLNELATISELRCGPPRINRTVFPSTGADVFWSKTVTPGNKQYVYTFSFGETVVDSSIKTSAHYIRLVRGWG